MNNMKKLSLLLLAVAGAGLTACNSGSSGTQSPKQSTVTNTESVTEQKLNASDGIAESTPLRLGDEHGTMGFVITKEGNLDYYVDDKFIRIVHKFEDKPTHVQMVQVGNGITGRVSIAYISTVSSGNGTTGGLTHAIHKCVLPVTSRTADCSEIYKYKGSYGEAGNDITGMYFDADGNGYVSTAKYTNSQQTLLQFKWDKLVGTRQIAQPGTINVDGDSIFISNSGGTIKYASFNDSNPITYPFKYRELSIDNFLNGFAITGDISPLSTANNLYRLSNGNAISIHHFEDNPLSLSVISYAVYVTTTPKSTLGGELKKCTPSGNCSTIDTFGSYPVDVSFREF